MFCYDKHPTEPSAQRALCRVHSQAAKASQPHHKGHAFYSIYQALTVLTAIFYPLHLTIA